jgi:hypothetical protein
MTSRSFEARPSLREIEVEKQSPEDFARYVDREIESSVPPGLVQHYGEIVRKLGLYRGAESLDFRATMKSVMASQVAAYCDPEQSTFYVVAQDMPAIITGSLYAHELY